MTNRFKEQDDKKYIIRYSEKIGRQPWHHNQDEVIWAKNDEEAYAEAQKFKQKNEESGYSTRIDDENGWTGRMSHETYRIKITGLDRVVYQSVPILEDGSKPDEKYLKKLGLAKATEL